MLFNKHHFKRPNPHPRVPEEEVAWIDRWLLESAPVRSGSLNERYLPWGTWGTMHFNYQRAVQMKNLQRSQSTPAGVPFPVRSKKYVRGRAKALKVKIAKFDKYLCAICWQGKNPEDNTFDATKKSQMLEKI